jgi:hypothetical protein
VIVSDKTEAVVGAALRESAGSWQWIEQFSIWEYDQGQWVLFVEPIDGGTWAATVHLGTGHSLPVRARNNIASMAEAKRWAVLALHEVARAMLDVRIPNMYEAVKTDEVHTLNGAPFDDYIW